jgi:hypothetical protein
MVVVMGRGAQPSVAIGGTGRACATPWVRELLGLDLDRDLANREAGSEGRIAGPVGESESEGRGVRGFWCAFNGIWRVSTFLYLQGAPKKKKKSDVPTYLPSLSFFFEILRSDFRKYFYGVFGLLMQRNGQERCKNNRWEKTEGKKGFFLNFFGQKFLTWTWTSESVCRKSVGRCVCGVLFLFPTTGVLRKHSSTAIR